MSEALMLHDAAMKQADLADDARRAGDAARSREHLAVAYKLERAAAEATPPGLQPTRAVLLRSAATLARDCRWPGEVRDLGNAVLADPTSPQEIVAEVEELLAEGTA